MERLNSIKSSRRTNKPVIYSDIEGTVPSLVSKRLDGALQELSEKSSWFRNSQFIQSEYSGVTSKEIFHGLNSEMVFCQLVDNTTGLVIYDVDVSVGGSFKVVLHSSVVKTYTDILIKIFKADTDLLVPIIFLENITQIGGTSGTSDSTGLTLTFSVDPTTLTADDITLTGASKGALSGTGLTRTLAISDITVGNGETVSVSIISSSGYSISGSPKTAVVYKDTITYVTFESAVAADGADGTANTTELNLTFSVNPTTLSADDITVIGATKGALSGTGTTRTLAISSITVGNGETVSVAIANPSGYSISGSPKTAVVYRAPHIGMAYQGGIIAYTLQSGDPDYVLGETHGLIASIADLSTGVQWGGYGTTTGATGTALGTGQANTTTIVATLGAFSYAAKLCDDYVNAETGTGVYSDWFLPSKDELNKLYMNKDGVGGFVADGYYWCSSESSENHATAQYFYNGNQNVYPKTSAARVRAVRAF
jgi:hypothetical protein